MHVIVVGAGVMGLSAAWQAVLRGARVTVLERFDLGHDRGSSHGHARITRSTYPAETYVRLAKRARAEAWPQLEHDAETQLLHPVTGCFFGPAGAALDSYLAAIAVSDDIEVLDVDEGRRRFPAFVFPGAGAVIEDRSAALVDASATMRALADQCRALGVRIHRVAAVQSIESGTDNVVVATDTRRFTADRVIVAAGAWTSRLVPSLAAPLTVIRQNVGFFELSGPVASRRLPEFPVWAYLAPDTLHYYGLPEFGRDGVKAARHVAAGPADDPDEIAEADEEALVELEAWLRGQLAVDVVRRVGAKTCLYTNTVDEDFVIDTLPSDHRIVVAAGFSGHGFKFGPLIGRILAELALDGRTSVPDFEADRARFAMLQT